MPKAITIQNVKPVRVPVGWPAVGGDIRTHTCISMFDMHAIHMM